MAWPVPSKGDGIEVRQDRSHFIWLFVVYGGPYGIDASAH
jgi:hypothetical protein